MYNEQVHFAQPIGGKLAAPVKLMVLCHCGAQLATLFTKEGDGGGGLSTCCSAWTVGHLRRPAKISDMPGNPLTVPRKVRKGPSVLAAPLCVFAEISPVA